jgi:hypothetical protein
MLERIQRIKAAMNKTAEKYPVVNIDEDRWQQLDDVITILKLFQVFTDQLQSDDAMLSVVYKGFENICEHVKNVSKQLHTAELKVMDWKSEHVKTSVLMNIRKRYQGNIATAAVKLVHILSRSKEGRLISDIEPATIKQTMLHNIKRLANNSMIDQYSNDTEIKDEAARQWTAFQSSEGEFMPTSAEPITTNISYESIREYWMDRLNSNETEMLATIALAMISINPSEASVERSFSQQKLTHSVLRNRLADEVVEAQMFIKMNVPLLTTKPTKKDRTITYEYQGIDAEGAVEAMQDVNAEWSKELDTTVE